MTNKAKAKRPAARKTGETTPELLRVDLLDRLFGLDGENVVRQEKDGAGKVRHVPIDLRYLVKFALDQKAPPGETMTASLRRGSLLESLRGTEPVDLDTKDIEMIEDSVLAEWTPFPAQMVREAIGLASAPGGKPTAGSIRPHLDGVILDPADNPQTREGPRGDVPLTVRHAIRVALNARPAARSSVIVDSKGRLQGPIPREEMIHRGDLIRRLGEGGADYVDVNDIKLIEDCVHRHCDRSVLHAVRCALIPVARADDAKDAA
ncbi:hypothetical protein AAG604_10570 [Citromicrobium bathyomarinum]